MLRPLICFAGQFAFLLKNRRMPAEPKKIAIMRSGGIGDVLMSTPLVKAIRLQYPNAHITYIVGKWSQDAIKTNPNVDAVMTYDDDIIFKQKKEDVKKLIARIKAQNFELAFVLDKAWQFNALAYMAKIHFRIGFDRKGEGFSLNKSVPFEGKKYELEYYRDLAIVAGIAEPPREMQFYYSKKDTAKAVAAYKQHKLIPKKTVVLIPGGARNPGQELAQKRWPAQHYGRLADQLLAMKYQVVLLGGPTDKDILEAVSRNMKNKKAVIISGKLALSQTAAFLSLARLTITHDSGPMHLAAAVRCPLIAIFGPTDLMRFAPLSAHVIHDFKACPPCYDIYGNLSNQKGSLALISLDTVLAEATKMLRTQGVSGRQRPSHRRGSRK